MGKNTVAQIALGKTPEDEYKDNLRHVGKVSLAIFHCIDKTYPPPAVTRKQCWYTIYKQIG